MTSRTPAPRQPDSPVSAAARALAHRSWARTPDRAARTAPARAAALARFVAEVDPDGFLPPAERARRAEAARRAWYVAMGRIGGRAARRAATDGAGQ